MLVLVKTCVPSFKWYVEIVEREPHLGQSSKLKFLCVSKFKVSQAVPPPQFSLFAIVYIHLPPLRPDNGIAHTPALARWEPADTKTGFLS